MRSKNCVPKSVCALCWRTGEQELESHLFSFLFPYFSFSEGKLAQVPSHAPFLASFLPAARRSSCRTDPSSSISAISRCSSGNYLGRRRGKQRKEVIPGLPFHGWCVWGYMHLDLTLMWHQVKVVAGPEPWALGPTVTSQSESVIQIWGVGRGRPMFLIMYLSCGLILSAHLCCCLAFVLLTNSHIKKCWILTEWGIKGSFDVWQWSKKNGKANFVCRTNIFYEVI